MKKIALLMIALCSIALYADAKTYDVALSLKWATAETVTVPMDINKWDKNANPMAKGTDEAFHVVIKLPAGEYQYKFVINGKEWLLDPNAAKVKNGDFENSLLSVGTPEEIQAAKAAAGTKETAVSPKSEEGLKEVELTFKSDAKTVCVPMTNPDKSIKWDKKANPMEKGADGLFHVKLKLKPGKYFYSFWVDDKNLVLDPNAPKEKVGKFEDSVLEVK
ncbi:MAG: hypothetical protein PHW04_09045 [Candidatus Wallbacteria bacterium]|nr:hypothetical protein [Candidatus Wallbacteria bacterium]